MRVFLVLSFVWSGNAHLSGVRHEEWKKTLQCHRECGGDYKCHESCPNSFKHLEEACEALNVTKTCHEGCGYEWLCHWGCFSPLKSQTLNPVVFEVRKAWEFIKYLGCNAMCGGDEACVKACPSARKHLEAKCELYKGLEACQRGCGMDRTCHHKCPQLRHDDEDFFEHHEGLQKVTAPRHNPEDGMHHPDHEQYDWDDNDEDEHGDSVWDYHANHHGRHPYPAAVHLADHPAEPLKAFLV